MNALASPAPTGAVAAAAPAGGALLPGYAALMRRRLARAGLLAAVLLASVLGDIATGPSSGLGLWEVAKVALGIVGGTLQAAPALLGGLLADAGLGDGPGVAAVWRSLGLVDAPLEVIVWHNRLPFALMAAAVGLSLGLAGAEMQTVLDNPLASPFTLGVAEAAAFGAAMVLVLGLQVPGVSPAWSIAVSAFACAMGTAALLDWASRWRGIGSSGVVLFGIALYFTFQALISLTHFVASAEDLQSLVFWTMGSFQRGGWTTLAVLSLALAVCLPWSLRGAWQMTALRLGEERAASFGIDVRRVRRMSLLRISVLTALAVSFVGVIGFVGLVSPHIARRIFGEDHRFYLPGSALVGAVVLSLASILSKSIHPQMIVPVSIVTALIGIPFFLTIVLRSRGALR